MSELYEFYTERRRKHYHQRHQLLREGAYLKDPSCTECYPLIFEPKTYFKNFWKWYKNITPAETYNLYTVRQLEELVTDTIGIIEVETTGIQKKLEMIIGSVTYREKPDKTSKEIYQEILDRFTYSNRFELNNEEVEELLKSSDENGSEKEEQINEELLKNSDENSSEKEQEDTKNNEELEDTEESILRIICGRNGPYRIEGRGTRWKVEFGKEDEEYMEKSEFEEMCKENGIIQEEYERILEIIADGINRITEEMKTETEVEELSEQIEKDINTNPILSNVSTVESEESNRETTTEESTDTEEEIEDMALNIIRAPTFGGEAHENPAEWIDEFDRAARANNWAEGDANDNQRLQMAAAHLRGEAAIWYEANRGTYNRWKNNGNAANQLAEGLKARFAPPERQQRWQREFYEVRQLQGESVENYVLRFPISARKVGNNVAEIGKAGTFSQGLLPVIYPLAILGDQSTLERAIESAKRGEMSALGNLQQIRPNLQRVVPMVNQGELINSEENRVYRDMKKEKTDKDMDELTKQMQKMVTLMERQDTRSRWRNENYRENNQRNRRPIVCYACNEVGHIAPECPNNRRRNDNYQNRDRRNEDHRSENRRNSNRVGNNRSLNFLSANREEEDALKYYEGSSSEEYSDEDEREIYELKTRSGRIFKPYDKKDKGKRVGYPEKRKVKFRETDEPMEEDEESEGEQTIYIKEDKNKINRKKIEALQRAREKAGRKNICNRCGNQGHWGTECPRLQCTRCGKKGHEWNKCLEYPMQTKPKKKKEFMIDESMKGRYEFTKYILKNLPRVSFEENIKYVPKYQERIYDIVQKYDGEKVNYLRRNGEPKYTPVTCEVNIQGIETEAIVNTGAGATIMSKELMKETQYEIDEPSDVNLTPLGDEKFRSLGRINNVRFFIGNIEVKATVKVIDLPGKMFLLGTDWIRKEKVNINFRDDVINIEKNGKEYDIPISYLEEERYSDSEEEYEEEIGRASCRERV